METPKAAAATEPSRGRPGAPGGETLDIREKGASKDGQPQRLDRRLFIQLQAFSGCRDGREAARALEDARLPGVLYEDLGDPSGIGVLAISEDPAWLAGEFRRLLNAAPFSGYAHRPEFAMTGRTYSSGFEADLEDWLLKRPRRVILDPACPWAIWYPLRRTGAFAALAPQEQGQILREHGTLGHSFGAAGHVADIRLACAGLDIRDNDFVLGLVGRELYPLSALVSAMRSTRQTSTYIQAMGPFFVGRAAWRGRAA